jgi:hypothetical protein
MRKENGPTGNRTRDQESPSDAAQDGGNADETTVSLASDEHSDLPETSQENPSAARKTGPGPVGNGEG